MTHNTAFEYHLRTTMFVPNALKTLAFLSTLFHATCGRTISAFSPAAPCMVRQVTSAMKNSGGEIDSGETSTYESSDSSSKGIVSSLTGIVNFMMGSPDNDIEEVKVLRGAPPVTPEQLMEKIKDDYVVNNYLWTGDIYTPAFAEDCLFTDPTLSFTGRDKFVSNVQNLRPIVDSLVGEGNCRSDLLDIRLNEEDGYVQSRWNMVGELNRLPWRPKIDVIGRTKFWYRGAGDEGKGRDEKNDDSSGLRVYFYDEEWEIPAGRALLQLVTSAGTISNQPDEN